MQVYIAGNCDAYGAVSITGADLGAVLLWNQVKIKPYQHTCITMIFTTEVAVSNEIEGTN